MIIHCCGCEKKTDADLVTGKDVYPHRPDLYELPFWRCPECLNWVGCHHKTRTPTLPLGCIPTPEIKKWRGYIHKILDPMWHKGDWKRRDLYSEIAKRLGWKYHTAKIKSVDEARQVYNIVKEIRDEK